MLSGRTDPEAEAPILWSSHEKRRLPEKPLMLGKCEGKRRRGRQRTRWLDSVIGYPNEFDPTPGGSGKQEGLVCSGPWGHEESDPT